MIIFFLCQSEQKFDIFTGNLSSRWKIKAHFYLLLILKRSNTFKKRITKVWVGETRKGWWSVIGCEEKLAFSDWSQVQHSHVSHTDGYSSEPVSESRVTAAVMWAGGLDRVVQSLNCAETDKSFLFIYFLYKYACNKWCLVSAVPRIIQFHMLGLSIIIYLLQNICLSLSIGFHAWKSSIKEDNC